MKRWLVLLVVLSVSVVATPFCDEARISPQEFVDDSFCISSRKGQMPRVEIALENLGKGEIPLAELVAVTEQGVRSFVLDDPDPDRPWMAKPAPGYKRRFTYNPTYMGPYMWSESLYIRPRFDKSGPECIQKVEVSGLIDCHSKQKLSTIGVGMGFIKPGSSVEKNDSPAANVTNTTQEVANETVTPVVAEADLEKLIEAKILELQDKNNVSNVTETSSPTGAITTKVMGANFGMAIGALAVMGLVLAVLLSGSYALERHRHKKEQKEEPKEPEDGPPVLNAPEIEKITEEAKDVDELLK
ncbi:MAG: hypothetical protein QF486_01235 [Candidatus Woesearchaeota archaeon]|jgi:hypothetical protein|nr:hypothetical protein [Candidatus Woesearchaeota archaeon]MDP7198218.1 hypothetical protein [Candidatus Woesearchaeota archaeon]MDP7467054.1 hypothetical protein [Candidatus Woesearchaeota archaeon]MDP7646722.1 hypothetical protein [Candidatus Woesearchaeota archaeon]